MESKKNMNDYAKMYVTESVIELLVTIINHPETSEEQRKAYIQELHSPSSPHSDIGFFLRHFCPTKFRPMYHDDKQAMSLIFLYGLANCDWAKVKREFPLQ